MSDHIHKGGDGLPPRAVYVDGARLFRCIYADTERGIARYHPDPIKFSKRRQCVISRKIRSAVTVEFLPNA